MKRLLCILTFLLILFLFSGITGAANISVSSDTHVQPVAEFESSNDYPDILLLENDVLKLTSIPNRGRVIFNLILKETGNEVIYHTFKTLPMIDGSETIYELGGLYFARPWDQRDVQPYPLKYEILTKKGKEIRVKLYNHDFKTDLYTEIYLSLEEGSNTVDIKVTHENQGKEDITIPYWDRFVVNPGSSPEGIFLDLPAEKMTIGESKNDWLGVSGKTTNWPQPVRQWSNIKGKTKFSIAADDLEKQVINIGNEKSGDLLTLKWDYDWLTTVKVLAYGRGYKDEMGAFPGYRITRYSPEITIKPGDTFSYDLSLTVQHQ